MTSSKFSKISFLSEVEFAPELTSDNIKKAFDLLYVDAKRVCQLSVSICNQKTNDPETLKKIQSQHQKRLRASSIFRSVKSGNHKGFTLTFNKYGQASAQLIVQGQEIRTADLDAMGIFCDCPDSNRGYNLCKHKIALAGLVVEIGNRLKLLPDEVPLDKTSLFDLQSVLEGLQPSLEDIQKNILGHLQYSNTNEVLLREISTKIVGMKQLSEMISAIQ